MITADTLTDEQIAELRAGVIAEMQAGGWPPLQGYDSYARLTYAQRQCDVALGEKRARKGSSKKDARARCAEILNARAKESK